MTTENVAILFTDIVGSTELSQRLSPEAADEVRRGHFSVLRQAIAQTGGTEVKNVGDGVMAVFGSASAALGCAVAMQQGVEQDNRLGRHPSVGLRIGLSGGEVVPEDNDYWGDSVIEAARLCALCEGGQILASDVVRLTAGRRSPHRCRSVGALSLKGLPDPVGTVEVLWEPLEGAPTGLSIPLPRPLAVGPAVGVVGRASEVGLLNDATKRVATGEGREVLLVSGEAGLGKTTLVAEAARSAFDDGACVLFGHCEEDLATPYQLFAEALGHYVSHAKEEDLVAHVAEHGSELARLVPALGRRLPGLAPSKATDTDTERYLLFAAVVGLLAIASHHQPVVLVLDDLQWADTGSLQLLRHLAGSDAPMRLLVLGTYRDSELSNAHALVETLASLRRLGGMSRIELVGLDDAGVMALMEAAAGHELEDDAVGLAHAIYRETDGNPFFVSEVLRNLVETGAIAQNAEGRWEANAALDVTALPDSVREIIGGRVVRLGEAAGRVLSMAAVIGRAFDLDLLARATKASEDELLDILDAASAVALVRELADTGRYNFAHALIQHTLYEDLGPTRRARAHRHVAEALEDVCGDRPGDRVGELARHWFSSIQPIDLTKAMDYSRQAGDTALRALAPADALRYYAQALDLYSQATDPDPLLGIDLAIGFGTAQRQTGDPAFRDTLLDAAHRAAELGDTDRLVAAALANDRGIFTAFGVIDADKVAILEAALEGLRASDTHRPLALANLCGELTWITQLERRRALADEAIALAEASGDDATMVRVLNHVSLPLLVPPLLDQSLERSAQSLALAERVGDPALLFWAATLRRIAAACAGDIEELDRCFGIAGSQAEQLDQPTLNWVQTFSHATRALVAGDADLAEQLATEALQIGTESGEPDAAGIFGPQLMGVAFIRGTMGELVTIIEQSAIENPGVPSFVAALSLAQVEGGDTDAARHLLEEFASTDFDLPSDFVWLTGMTCYAEAAIECRDPKYAEPMFERLSPWSGRLASDAVTTMGPVDQFLGGLTTVIGRYDEANAYFAQCSSFCDRVGAKFFAARTDLSWGRMLAERQVPGDIEKARDLLTKAQTVAAAHGYGTVERRAVAALQLIDA